MGGGGGGVGGGVGGGRRLGIGAAGGSKLRVDMYLGSLVTHGWRRVREEV